MSLVCVMVNSRYKEAMLEYLQSMRASRERGENKLVIGSKFGHKQTENKY